jgi:hypothetical protein
VLSSELIIAMKNTNFLGKKCDLLRQFINESLLHSIHELIQVSCKPSETNSKNLTKFLYSDNQKKGCELQGLPFH